MFRRRYRRTLPATIKVWLYHWRAFQFEHSRWIIFWTLRELREHYRLWRMRPAILAKPRSLMVEGKQVYHYQSDGPSCGYIMVPIKDAPLVVCKGASDHWKKAEPYLFNSNIDDTAYEVFPNHNRSGD